MIPALQEAFGSRYGGFWIDPRRGGDVMHVGVVGATPEDAAVVSRLTGGHRRVVTDPVELGYDELLAAQDEVSRTLAGTGGNVAVTADVATTSLVVQTASADPARVTRPARDAARRGVAGERARPDPATAVVVERDPSIAITPPVDRVRWNAYEAGLRVSTASTSLRTVCTSGFALRNARFGYLVSTAGHCNRMPAVVALGSRWVTSMSLNRYHGVTRMAADVSFYSLTTARIGASARVRAAPRRPPSTPGI